MLGGGLHPGLSFEFYTDIPAANISALKEMTRSPLHYRYRLAHQKETPALALGRAAHAAVLEPERFETDFVLWDQLTESGRLRPRNGKDWDAFCEANKGKTILKPDDHRHALNVRDAVRAKRVAKKYLMGGKPEMSMLWTDAATGHPCKGRVDWITYVDAVDCIVGLKSARDLDPRRFASQAATLGYPLQWAFYFDGYSTITGNAPRMVEICVEASPPHDVIVFVIPDEVIEYGREEYRACLSRLIECERSDRWLGRAENEVFFELPTYLQERDDEDLAGLELEGEERSRAVALINEDL
jgi:hypothetical protein